MVWKVRSVLLRLLYSCLFRCKYGVEDVYLDIVFIFFVVVDIKWFGLDKIYVVEFVLNFVLLS